MEAGRQAGEESEIRILHLDRVGGAMERQTDDAPYDDGRMNLCLNLMPVEEVSLGGEAHQ